MLTPTLHTLSTATAAQGARASVASAAYAGQARPRQDAVAQPTAAEPLDAAVVNHVRLAGERAQAPGQAHAHEAPDPASVPVEGAEPAAPKRPEPEPDHADAGGVSGGADQQPDDEEAAAIRELAARDTEVRAHEQAHAAAGGAYAGAPSFEYQRGPDGRRYAVSGEVPIDVSSIAGDPEATIAKMQQVKRAALAPQEPSGADRAIAAAADAKIVAARGELSTADTEQASGAESASDVVPTTQAGEADAVGATEGDAQGKLGEVVLSARSLDARPAGDGARAALGALERRSAAAAAYYAALVPAAGGAVHVVS